MSEEDTIVVYRNCGYEYPLLIENASFFPEDIDGYSFAFIVAPTQPNRSFGTPLISNITPVISPELGEITFVLLPTDTSSMSIGTAYEYRVMIAAPASSPQVVKSGRIRLRDAPAFP